jgi:mono/diheme cytochrome c family protein
MNYPIWSIPSAGLLIAAVAIVHVFISHFAVGGGLFLVLTERKARREHDAALLDYVERHSRFFVLLTLVAGAMTGVAIWFTIGLVHPAATTALTAAFVFGWAIEWTFFLVEIAAAMVYYYGWHRLAPAVHMRVGWIYFWAAWLSLAVINAILSFMLTPGAWIQTHGFWDGVLNPTYVPSVVVRTAAAVGLAGLYAVLTATWLTDAALRRRVARYAAIGWILPMAVIMPLGVAWYLSAASGAGIPVMETFGAKSRSILAVFQAALAGSPSGSPIAQRALIALVLASVLIVPLTLALLGRRGASYGRVHAGALMVCGFVALGAGEWVREDLRKPYVIGQYMFVNGMHATGDDAFARASIDSRGVLATAAWAHPTPDGPCVECEIARGREIFRLSCSSCHSIDGYLAIRPLARGMTVAGAHGAIGRLATWRNRRMQPFAGTAAERHDLAVYLANVGGATPADINAASAGLELGARVFDETCSVCHGADSDAPFRAKGRSADELYALIGRLPDLNDAMSAFEGNETERRALAAHLVTLEAGAGEGGVR